MEMALIIANILLVVATFALVVVTWYYARHTNRMADVMYKDYELRTTPLADIQDIQITEAIRSKPQRIVFSLIVTNKGYCKIRLRSVDWYWWSKIQEGTKKMHYTHSLPQYSSPDTWLTEGQERRFNNLPETDIPEEWRVPGFNLYEHIAVDGWVELESPTGVVKQYKVKRGL